jgi:hypothetical protein
MEKIGRLLAISAMTTMSSGCVAGYAGYAAASYALSAGSLAVSAYGLREVYRDGELSLEAKTIELPPDGASALAGARSVAIWPVLDGTDGAIVDKARPIVGAKLVEPSRTTKWVRDQKVALNDLSENERAEKMRAFGKAMGADVVVLTQYLGQEVETGFMSAPVARVQNLTTAVDVRTGKVVWKEEHTLVQDGIQGMNAGEMNTFLIRGIATRFNEAATGKSV